MNLPKFVYQKPVRKKKTSTAIVHKDGWFERGILSRKGPLKMLSDAKIAHLREKYKNAKFGFLG